MGKLNYTNRRVTGAKLGQIISKDLLKRISPNYGTKATHKDPFLEIHASDKKLQDDGIREVSKGLVDVLKNQGGESVTRLEELCLSGNAITVQGLLSLKTSIELAVNDLKDLDLSRNEIRVDTDSDALAWERFLSAFENCTTLRRLDLSGNPLGPRGLEIFMRAYARAEPVDLPSVNEAIDDDVLQTHQGPVHNVQEGSQAGVLDERTETVLGNGNGSTISHRSRAAGGRSTSRRRFSGKHAAHSRTRRASYLAEESYSMTRGLRSIPYLVLSDVSMMDTGALHLSYILEVHHLPRDLLPFISPAKPAPQVQLEAYDAKSGCRGIIYRPHHNLSAAGERLLELAEASREHTASLSLQGGVLHDITATEQATKAAQAISRSEETLEKHRQRLSVGRSELGSKNVAGGHSFDDELERARSKIQGKTLKEDGASVVDLWKAALRLLATGRAILVDQTEIRKGNMELWQRHRAATCSSKGNNSLFTGEDYSMAFPSLSENSRSSRVAARRHDDQQPSISRTTSEHRRATSELPMSQLSISGSANAGLGRLPGGLPEKIWHKIIMEAADPSSILDESQQMGMLAWARSRHTLGLERELMGKPVATQIWRVLCATGCLAYDMRV